MDNQTLVAPDQARLDLMQRCETQIEDGKRRGRDAIRTIAKALNKINNEQLYLDRGYDSFNGYVEGHLRMDRHVALHVMCAGETILTLENGGIEIAAIPAVESQLVLLHKIPKEELATAWREGVKLLDEKGLPVNTANIKRIVDFTVSRLAAEEETPKVNPTLDLGRRSLSEDAEGALERIGRLAGAPVKEAIEQGTITISERDLIRWADQDDQTVSNLAYYIVHARWSLKKALEYEALLITNTTTVSDLTLLASARGGEYAGEVYANNAPWRFHFAKADHK